MINEIVDLMGQNILDDAMSAELRMNWLYGQIQETNHPTEWLAAFLIFQDLLLLTLNKSEVPDSYIGEYIQSGATVSIQVMTLAIERHKALAT